MTETKIPTRPKPEPEPDDGADLTLRDVIQEYCPPEEFQAAVSFISAQTGYKCHPDLARKALLNAILRAVIRPAAEEEALDRQAVIAEALSAEVEDITAGEAWKNGENEEEGEDEDG